MAAGLTFCLASTVGAQFGNKKILLQRMLPPAIELEARPFGIDAMSQESAANPIAASFKQAFRAKIQGDERFVYNESDPSLRIAIAITRYYIEPKQLPGPCTTYTGSLRGTFQVLEVVSRRPLASDTIGWSVQTGRTRHWLVAADGREMNIKGPTEKLTLSDTWKLFEAESASSPSALSRLPGLRRGPTPCDRPLTGNETRDLLADAFMAEIVQMAMPYRDDVEVPIFSNRAIARAVEDARAGEWSKALDGALAVKPLPGEGDEGERLYLIGLANEALGYREGSRALDLNRQIQGKLPADELAGLKAELQRVVDHAKELFDKAATSYGQANRRSEEQDYRDGERRADQARRLYARIQRYRDLPPESVTEPRVDTVRLADVLTMCARDLHEDIIVDRIVNADSVDIKPSEYGDLSQCGTRQKVIFQAIVARRTRDKASGTEQAAKKPAGTAGDSKPPLKSSRPAKRSPND